MDCFSKIEIAGIVKNVRTVSEYDDYGELFEALLLDIQTPNSEEYSVEITDEAFEYWADKIHDGDYLRVCHVCDECSDLDFCLHELYVYDSYEPDMIIQHKEAGKFGDCANKISRAN